MSKAPRVVLKISWLLLASPEGDGRERGEVKDRKSYYGRRRLGRHVRIRLTKDDVYSGISRQKGEGLPDRVREKGLIHIP